MSRTRSSKRSQRKTLKRERKIRNKRQYVDNRKKSHIVRIFLEMLNSIKLYHWKTRSFSQHKATDELYERMNEHVDKFIEVLLGKDQSRIRMVEKNIHLIDSASTRDFQTRIFEYREFLTDMNIYFDSSRDSDLLNIRDEILGDINQFLYLLTFDK
jgi:DNA-binding ferritin-like protein